MSFGFRSTLYLMIIGSLSLTNLAKASDADLCDQSIEQVSISSLVPREIIYKIARLADQFLRALLQLCLERLPKGLGPSRHVGRALCHSVEVWCDP